MTFEEFKEKFPWVFWADNIEHHVSTHEEIYANYRGEETNVHHVEVSINSKTPNGELSASVTLTPQDAIIFIAHMTQYLDSKQNEVNK